MYIKAIFLGLLLALAGCGSVTGKDASTAHALCRVMGAELLHVKRSFEYVYAYCDGALTIKVKIK